MDKRIIGYVKGPIDKTKTSSKPFNMAYNIAQQAMIRDPKIIDTELCSYDKTWSRPLLQRSDIHYEHAA